VIECAYRPTSRLAASVATTVSANSAVVARVNVRWSYASPPSGSHLAAFTSSGTTMLVRMPPSIRS
jgi:hypothetical protein